MALSMPASATAKFQGALTLVVRALRKGPVAFARRHALSLRVAIAVAASVGFLVFASEAFFTRAASRELIQQDARSYVADASALETAYQEGSDPADAIDDVLDLVDSMEDRLGIDSATLLDGRREGRDGAARRQARERSRHEIGRAATGRPTPTSRRVRSDGISTSPCRSTSTASASRCRSTRTGKLLHARVAALSNEALIFSVASLLIGMALFYVVGGRTLARRHSLVVKRATRDSLTDLGNHRSFQDELARAVAVAARRQEPLALALVDLDDFKFINDRYGHRRGDEVLLQVARVLERGRAEDRAFRIGGDEFALLCRGPTAPRRASASNGASQAVRGRRCQGLVHGRCGRSASRDRDRSRRPLGAGRCRAVRGQAHRCATSWSSTMSRSCSRSSPRRRSRPCGRCSTEPRIEIAFQPIWDLQDGRVLGLEALARPWPGYGFDGPGDMFAVAEKIGRAHELDAVCRSAALARAHEIPDGVLLFLNVQSAVAHTRRARRRPARAHCRGRRV